MQDRSAEVIAVNNFMRYIFSAAASGFVKPMINKAGVGPTSILFAFLNFLAWLGFLLILLTIKFGDRMRSFANKLEGIGQVESKEANLSEK